MTQLQATPLLSKKLRPATFRKIPFQVDSAGFETGRRVQTHEYPQRDVPYSQDLGRKTREISFDAFVIGADYVEKANMLLGAIEEYGSGALVHPWLGTLTVNVLTCHVTYDRSLGIARFSLSFVEAGLLKFPSSEKSTRVLSRMAAAKLEEKSVSRFAQVFKVLGYINKVAEYALTAYGQILSFIANPLFSLASIIGFSTLPGNLNSLGALFTNSLSLGWAFAGLLDLSAFGKSTAHTDAELLPAIRGLTRMAVDPSLCPPTAQTYTTPTNLQIYANKKAAAELARHCLLIQAVGLSSYLTCEVYDDILDLKNELAAALDAEALQSDDDELYQALMGARSAMWEDLTLRSRDSSRLSILTPDDIFPMLALAYDYYEDAGRDLEIVARNKISNPGFIPVAPLLVLSR